MQVTVEFYGGLKEIVGARQWQLELEPEGDVNIRDVLERIYVVLPSLRAQEASFALAVGDELVEDKHVVSDGDLIGLLPPVSGG